MSKIVAIARHEFLQRVRQRSFILATLGIPIGIGALMALAVMIAIRSEDRRPVGFVDHSGLLDNAARTTQVEGEDLDVEIWSFPDEAQAQVALYDGEIQAYYLIPEDYPREPLVETVVLNEAPAGQVTREFEKLLRARLSQDMPVQQRTRIQQGFEITVRSADGRREVSEDEGIVNLLLPYMASFIFFLTVMSAGGYMVQAVADEKENRTMEVLVTSVTPERLLTGKLLGLLAVALLQMLALLGTLAVALTIGITYLDFLREFEIPWMLVAIMLLFFFPAYLFTTGLMATLGVMVIEVSQGQQLAGQLNLLFMMPWFFTPLFLAGAQSPLILAFTFIPFTSFLTVIMRWSLGTVPFWQLSVSWLLLVSSAVFSLWLATRVFRLGMLRYGKRLSLKSVWNAIRRGVKVDLREVESHV